MQALEKDKSLDASNALAALSNLKAQGFIREREGAPSLTEKAWECWFDLISEFLVTGLPIPATSERHVLAILARTDVTSSAYGRLQTPNLPLAERVNILKTILPPHVWAVVRVRSTTGVPEGERNDTATRLAGILFQALDPEDGKNLVRGVLAEWNSHNKPPLEDAELDTVIQSIAEAERRKRNRINQLRVLASVWPWDKHTGGSDHAVYQAFLTIASRVGSEEFDASLRELAELSNRKRQTVIGATRRLEKMYELITRLNPPTPRKKGEKREMARWRLVFPSEISTVVTTSKQSSVGADCFWQRGPGGVRGLGPTLAMYYDELDSTPKNAREVARLKGRTVRTVERHLKRLAKFNLSRKTEDGWIRGPGSLEAAAHALGMLGRGEQEKTLHQAERGQWQKKQAIWETSVKKRRKHDLIVDSKVGLVNLETGEIP